MSARDIGESTDPKTVQGHPFRRSLKGLPRATTSHELVSYELTSELDHPKYGGTWTLWVID